MLIVSAAPFINGAKYMLIVGAALFINGCPNYQLIVGAAPFYKQCKLIVGEQHIN